MTDTLQTFLKKSEEKAYDIEHRRKLLFNIGKYKESVKKGVLQYTDIELAKKRAKNTLFFGKNTHFGEKSAEKEESKDNCQTLFFNQKVKKCQTWVKLEPEGRIDEKNEGMGVLLQKILKV